MAVLKIRNAGNTAWIDVGGIGSLIPAKHKHNLEIKAGTTGASQVTITADELVVSDTGGAKVLLESVSESDVAITASGAGGLDTGSEASSTMYYIWIIYGTSGTAGMFSASASSPTMPSGYTYKRLVGEIYNNSSSNFVECVRNDDTVWFEDPQTVYDNQTLTTSFVQHNLPSAVPAGCIELTFGLCDRASAGNLQVVRPENNATHEIETARLDTAQGGYGGMGSAAYRPEYRTMKHLGATSIYARTNAPASQAYQALLVWGYKLQR